MSPVLASSPFNYIIIFLTIMNNKNNINKNSNYIEPFAKTGKTTPPFSANNKTSGNLNQEAIPPSGNSFESGRSFAQVAATSSINCKNSYKNSNNNLSNNATNSHIYKSSKCSAALKNYGHSYNHSCFFLKEQ